MDTVDDIFYFIQECCDAVKKGGVEQIEAKRAIAADKISKHQELSKLDGCFMLVGTGASSISIFGLTNSLIKHACVFGVKKTKTDFDVFMNRGQIEVKTCLFLDGVVVQSSLIEVAGLEVFEFYPEQAEHRSMLVENEERDDPTYKKIRVGIQKKHQHPIIIKESAMHSAESFGLPNLWEFSEQKDFIDCMSLVKPGGQVILATAILIEQWTPYYPYVIGQAPYPIQVNHYVSYSNRELTEVGNLLEEYARRKDTEKRKLRMAFSKLRAAVQRRSIDESFIDLGIAFEVLYIDNEGNEALGLKIRLRAARFIGEDPSVRKDIYDTVKKVYNFRSEAVHNGAINAAKKGLDLEAEFNKGLGVLVNSLRAFVVKGFPDNWDYVLLN